MEEVGERNRKKDRVPDEEVQERKKVLEGPR
jgi:hypothetical protein